MTTLLCIKKTMNDYLTILHVNNGLAPPGVRIFPSGDWTLRWLALGWDLDLCCGDGMVGISYEGCTVCQVLSIKREKFCTQMGSRSVMWDREMISRWAHFAMCKVLSLRTEKFCYNYWYWLLITDYWLLIVRRGGLLPGRSPSPFVLFLCSLHRCW